MERRIGISLAISLLGFWACGAPTSVEEAANDVPDAAPRDASRDIGMTEPDPPKDASGDVSPSRDEWNPWDDPTVWKRLPGLEPCEAYEADLSVHEFPRRDWSSCGVGCEVASAQYPIDLDEQQATSRPALAGTSIDGTIYLRLNVGTAERGAIYEIVRLPENRTVAAIKLSHASPVHCGMSGFGYDAAMLFPLSRSTGGPNPDTTYRHVARADGDGVLSWQEHWQEAKSMARGVFPWEEAWGVMLEDGTLRALESLSATNLTILASGIGTTSRATARGDLVVAAYRNGAGRRVVGGYSPANGWQDLISKEDGTIWDVALSDTHIVWIGTEGPESIVTESAEMYWSPLATTADEIVISAGPSMPVLYAPTGLKAGGDYAAVIGVGAVENDRARNDLLVVRLSTKQLWALPPRPGGNTPWGLLAVSQDEIVYAENDAPIAGAEYQSVKRLVRLKTAELDAIQAAWAKK